MGTLNEKVEHAKLIIKDAASKYKRIAVACSFGKDSMVAVHLSRSIEPKLPIFSVMTIYKPSETLEYLIEINREMNLDATVYIVADEIPEIFKENKINTVLLPAHDFHKYFDYVKEKTGKSLYETNPDECCRLLKVEPTKEAVKDLDAWITGLRKTEGQTREDYQEVEVKGGLVKINPILQFTELDIWRYLAMNNIKVNPLYKKGYRSLGCEPCSIIVPDNEPERAGRWQGTSKCGGECGIHTRILK
ncbi:phosphoadenylyl-sulfate reductase [Candidatus Pacearchaeota archaeon]|nr:phosphoadenylyl-sulfate reductase [Candidatus Pacearchaeota archaeon]